VNIYKHFLDGTPEYLARHYWWAYLWQKSAWFFDHQPIINAILFGQYQKLMQATMQQLEHTDHARVLQLTCVYGILTPKLIEKIKPVPLHITDVAPVQLRLVASKATPPSSLIATRMNAEHLGYKDDSFTTTILFFCCMNCRLKRGKTHYPKPFVRSLMAAHCCLLNTQNYPKNTFYIGFFQPAGLPQNLNPFSTTFGMKTSLKS